MKDERTDPLREVLREWDAPTPDRKADARVLAAYREQFRPGFWRRIWSVEVRIPAPVLAAALLLMVGAWWWLQTRVSPPRPAPPAVVAAPDGGYATRVETAGFQPLREGEIRVIRSGVKR